MCGIFCSYPLVCNNFTESQQIYESHFEKLLYRRGPNSSGVSFFQNIFFAAHVLWHQGDTLTKQPIEDDNGILLFNGDLFMEAIIKSNTSDSFWLMRSLSKCNTKEEVKNLLKTLIGPFCMIYYKKSTNSLFFCRDYLGRNSLVLAGNGNSFILSSIANADLQYNIIELPSFGIYEICKREEIIEVNVTYWNMSTCQTTYFVQEEAMLRNFFRESGIQYKKVFDFIEPLWINKQFTQISYSFTQIFKKLSEKNFEILFQTVIKNIPDIINELINLLENSVRHRVMNTNENCKDCFGMNEKFSICEHATVGILFSGGVDCTILAIVADKFIQKNKPIDLLNVAFEKNTHKQKEPDWHAPDRQSAKAALIELRAICPFRVWNLIEINITNEEKMRTDEISNLIYPRKTVLDESLGVALWFAARGIDSNTSQRTSCRVLLIGSGADELFGGYTRHRLAFERGGEDGLKKELHDDWVRLPSRNLARDDRVVCDHGVTQRSPYIEEHLVQFLLRLGPLQKCFPALGPGIGDKTLLRACGYYLGLRETAYRNKKALQFGCRIAKSHENANDISSFLKKF